DPASAAHRQPLGTGTLAPGGRLVVDLTAFGVSCGSEGVAVVKASGVVLDAAPAGNDPDGYTYGRLPDISGAFTVTKPTRGAPNQAPDLDPFDPIGTLYDPLRPVANIALTLDATAYASLKAEPQTWVTGTFRLTDEFGTVEQPVGVRLKGRIGSFRTIDQKAGFKLDFNRWWPGGNMRGALAMTLNNMVQDGAKVHEMVAYALFRAMGVPAPRVGYVWVKVNGSDYGLYADIEAYAEPWYSNHFASTKAAFEGQYGDDFVQAQAYQLDLDEGSESGRVDLATLIDAVQYTPRGLGFMVATAAFVDWNEVLAMMATEIFIGHWDGYAPTRNNFIVHFDDDGLASLMPWGTDQTFASSLGWYDGQGLLLQGCMSDKACKIAFEAKLLDLAAIVDAGQVVDALAGVPDIIQPYIDVEPREGKGADASGGFDGAASFLDARSADIRGRIGCRRDPAQDADHDGASCDLDCADSDASRHWGAVDACGDGVDQDCDGKTDNGSTCEDCTPHATNGRNYLFCARPRARAAAAANCSAHGMTLVAIGAGTENSWLASEAKNAGMGSFWIGANDLGQEGVYTWVDGSPLAGNYRNYASNQPDDFAAAEDCTLLNPTAGNGTWNDVDCKLWLAAVCEQP
ncbi:MAG: CotH kinase family protein, partial [Myxococcota bacterium]